MAGALVAEALAHGDLGLAVATLAPGAVATADRHLGHRRAAADLPPRLHRRRGGGRRPRPDRAAAPLRRARAGHDRHAYRGRVRPRRREVDGAARRRGRALRRGCPPRRRERALPGRVRRRRPRRRGRPGDGRAGSLAHHAHPRRGPRPGERRARRRPTARRTPSACGSRASPGVPWPSGSGRRCSTTSRRTSRSARRSASRSPIGSRWRSWSPTSPSSCRRCGCSPGRPPRVRPPARTSPARSPWPARCAPRRGCGSASTASSSSVATASSRNTRWSGGTATSGRSRSWKAGCSSVISLDDPKKLRQVRDQAHQVAMNMLRPISRTYDRAEHAYPKELDLLAAMIDGLSESGASSGAGASGVKRDEAADHAKGRREERHQPGVGDVDRRDVLGRRGPAALPAPPGPRQLRDRLGRGRRPAGALRRTVGLDGDHRARHRLGLRQHPHHRRPRRRRVRAERREDLRHLGRALRRRRGLGDPRRSPSAAPRSSRSWCPRGRRG